MRPRCAPSMGLQRSKSRVGSKADRFSRRFFLDARNSMGAKFSERNSVVICSVHPYRQRVLLISAVLGYAALFQWMYENYLYPTWDYFGFHYNPPPTSCIMLAWILSVTPSLWMPMRLTRPSQLAYWVLYITVFIPSMFVPLYAGLDAAGEISLLILTLYAGFAIMGGCYRVPLLRLRPARISRRAFWEGFSLIAAALAIWMIVVFRGHMQFLSFNNIYDLRDIQNDVSEGTLVNYAFMLQCLVSRANISFYRLLESLKVRASVALR